MYNNQLAKQYGQFLQQAGFKYSKDNLGYYYDNGTKRFSIMKCGPLFNCFYNIKINNNWVLKGKKNGIMQYEICLRWILEIIQKGE